MRNVLKINLSIKRKLGIFFRESIGRLFIFEILEKISLNKKMNKNEIPPLIVIGAPRTGSTMFYQYITSKIKFAYISNISSIFFNAPYLVTKLLLRFHKVSAEIKNDHGVVDGFFAPSEARRILENWFDRKKKKMDTEFIRSSVFALSDLFDAPFLSKNMMNSMRIKEIQRIFPETLFVYLKRSPLYTGQSLIIARKKFNRSIEEWWSTEPEDLDEIVRKTPFEQVIYQVKSIEKFIEDNLENKNTNLIQINYSEFCKNPQLSINEIINWYESKNIKLRKIGLITNDELKNSNNKKLSDSEWKKLEQAYNNIYDKNTTW